MHASAGGPETVDETWADALPDTPEPAPATRFPGYAVDGEIGRGGGGVVLQARPVGGGDPVALKVLGAGSWATPAQRARFAREIDLARRIQDPGIVPVLDAGATADGVPWFTMPLVTGPSLAELVDDPVRPPWRVLARLLAQVARTLGRLHARGIRHRDIKPGNILLTEDGRPLLSDFGLALPIDETRLTRGAKAMGTPAYMAPEQLSGSTNDWTPVDIYGLGRVLIEMLDRPARAAPGRSAPAPPPRTLRWIADRATTRDPAQRHPDGHAMAAELEAWADGPGWAMPRAVFTARLARAWRQRTVRAAAVGGGLSVTLLAVGVFTAAGMRSDQNRLSEWSMTLAEVRASDEADRPEDALALLARFARLDQAAGSPEQQDALLQLADRQEVLGRYEDALGSAAEALTAADTPAARARAARRLAELSHAERDGDRLSAIHRLDRAEAWDATAPGDPLDLAAHLARRTLPTGPVSPEDAGLVARLSQATLLTLPDGHRVDAFGPDATLVRVGGPGTTPRHDGAGWQLPEDARAWPGADATDVLAWTTDRRLWSLEGTTARVLVEDTGRPPGWVVGIGDRVFTLDDGANAQVREVRDGALVPIDPELAPLTTYGLGMISGDADGDGRPDLIVSLGPPQGFLVRAWTVEPSGPPALLAQGRIGYAHVLATLPPTGAAPARVIASRVNAHAAPLVFGEDDPIGGPCGLVVLEARGGRFETTAELPYRGPRPLCPHTRGLSTDVDGDGRRDLVVKLLEDRPPGLHLLTIYRQNEDGTLAAPLHLRGAELLSQGPTGAAPVPLLVGLDEALDDGVRLRRGGYAWVGSGGDTLPPLPTPAPTLDPGACGAVQRALDLPAQAAAACEAEAAFEPVRRTENLSAAVQAWLDAARPLEALRVLQRIRGTQGLTLDAGLATEAWAAAARSAPRRTAAALARSPGAPVGELGPWLDDVDHGGFQLRLDRELPPAIERPLPGAVALDAVAQQLRLRIPAGVGPVLRVPLRTTGAPPNLLLAGTWLRGEWAAHVRVVLRPVGGEGLDLDLSVHGGSGRTNRLAGGHCDLRAAPGPIGAPEPLRLEAWWSPGEDVMRCTTGGPEPLRARETSGMPAPTAGERWELIISGAEPLLGAEGQLAGFAIDALEVSGMRLDTGTPEARSPWARWVLQPASAPPVAPGPVPTELVGLMRLHPGRLAPLLPALSPDQQADLLMRTWGVNSAIHPDDPMVRADTRALPDVPELEPGVRAWLSITRGSDLAAQGELDAASLALEEALLHVEEAPPEAWRAGLEACARRALVALARGEDEAARAWVARAIAFAPDPDMGRRLVRNRARFAELEAEPDWAALWMD